MEHKLFLDTNALINLQEFAFKERFLISQKTLEEIECIKTSSRKDVETKYKARVVSRLLDEYDGEYIVIKNDSKIKSVLFEFDLEDTPDNIILSTAYLCNQEQPIIVCTDDINCRFISRYIFQLPTKGVKDIGLIKNTQDYTGYKKITLSDEEMSDFYSNISENKFKCNVNEYLIIRNLAGEVVDTLCWNGDTYRSVCNRTIKSTLFGDKIKPKDVYQSFVVDSILNNTMTAITGRAGSGKSLISLVTIMYLIESGKYDRVIILFNPTKARGASDMGYYSGDAVAKAMQNSIGNMLTTKFGDQFSVQMLLQQDKMRLLSMADIRGMEVRDNEILYISECQNTSVELLKLCLSRPSGSCKIVIEGDYTAQTDSYLFDGVSNGLKRSIEVLTGENDFGYIHLPNIWRGRIAQLIDKL